MNWTQSLLCYLERLWISQTETQSVWNASKKVPFKVRIQTSNYTCIHISPSECRKLSYSKGRKYFETVIFRNFGSTCNEWKLQDLRFSQQLQNIQVFWDLTLYRMVNSPYHSIQRNVLEDIKSPIYSFIYKEITKKMGKLLRFCSESVAFSPASMFIYACNNYMTLNGVMIRVRCYD
jgi:hypothetical protein